MEPRFKADPEPGSAARRRLVRGRSRYAVAGVLLVGTLIVGACSSSAGSSNGAASPGEGSSTSDTGGASGSTSTSTGGSADFGGGKDAQGHEIGLTNSQIRIGVVADVDTPVSPGLFQKSVNAVKAWATLVNANGGLAGRQVVVDFIDSKHTSSDARNAVIQACSKDFALVGTEALNLSTMSDVDTCKDAAGAPTGIPNLAGIAIGLQQCDKNTYSADTPHLDPHYCSTRTSSHPEYTENVGPAKWEMSQNPGLHGILVYNTDVPGIEGIQKAQFTADVQAGIKTDGQGTYGASLDEPQSALTPLVQAVKRYGSSYVQNAVGPGGITLMMREAQLQGVNSVKVWDCGNACYTTLLTQQGGSTVNGVYDTLATIPFYSEYDANPTLKALVDKMGGIENLDSNAVSSFIEALLFQDAVKKAAATGTLDRASLFKVLKTDETKFDAQGIIGSTNVSKREPSPCFTLAQVQDGQWQRAYPSKPGTFDCSPSNLVVTK